jgi:hypothetical protein
MLKLPTKKTRIQLNFTLKKQTHPWDMIEEIAKAKHITQPQKTQQLTKNFRKNPFSLNEPAENELIKNLTTPHQACTEQIMETDEAPLDELDGPDEGFFLCPFCTCWFTQKKDLNFHLKNWCDHEQVNI